MRKLASIQRIELLEPIANADALERARVLGWWVVVKKGEFRPGETVVYCEIDSLLPERPEFEFLRPSSFKAALLDGEAILQRAGFRIRTVKLRGQVSQGICFPLSILPTDVTAEVGTDVTDALGIIKYEPPVPVGLGGIAKGPFPAFLPKTDELRVQILEDVLRRHSGLELHVTEKLDGTSFTAFLRQGEFGICSRNLWMNEADPTNLLARLADRLDLRGKLLALSRQLATDVALQGEVIGPGIQGNKYALKQTELFVFNLLDLASGRLVDHSRGVSLIREVGLVPVPQLGMMRLDHSVDELVEQAKGMSVLRPQLPREGLVFRPEREEFDETIGGRLSFKAINPQFLLKFDE